ncbi:NAD(P)H-dependent oxidoreductase [Alphaproteobacteria bacterium]|nr:NAD(P)H-dependent oxidoreductase [Alphaproteobacteria bacterium]MDB4234222.1 NAD(P)H-dependent oxidoreductase [Alphaproteobacteria bacterium]MDC0861444.1 NAD(P)H-dependent oxidoreductase [Alphaproteobacteria bacterium]
MNKILFYKTSPKNEGSISTELGEYLVNRLSKEGNTNVSKRQLDQVPFINQQIINGLYINDNEKTLEQLEAFKISDAIVKDVHENDTIIISTPIYNFAAPAVLKAWADLVARLNKTFQYTDNGPVGLLKNKKAYIVVSSGGTKIGSEIDFFTPWMRFFLNFIGIKDVTFISADQLMSDDGSKIIQAKSQINELFISGNQAA